MYLLSAATYGYVMISLFTVRDKHRYLKMPNMTQKQLNLYCLTVNKCAGMSSFLRLEKIARMQEISYLISLRKTDESISVNMMAA